MAASYGYDAVVRTGVIGDTKSRVMGYNSKHYDLEESDPNGRNNTICDVGAKCTFYGERTVRAVWDQPQDWL